MNDEQKALLAVAGRQDTGSIKQAQAAERKRLRAEAKAEREGLTANLKAARAALRAAAKKLSAEFERDTQRVKTDLAVALDKADSDIVERFREARVTQLNNGVIGIAIAQKDVQP